MMSEDVNICMRFPQKIAHIVIAHNVAASKVASSQQINSPRPPYGLANAVYCTFFDAIMNTVQQERHSLSNVAALSTCPTL